MIVCLAANPSVDRLFRVERLCAGTIHRPLDVAAVAGGKGLNVARASAQLGGEVHAVALLAGHTGRFIAEELQRAGVSFDAVWASGETRTCTSVAAADGTLTEFYERGDEVTPGDWTRFVAASRDAAGEADWMTVSGSLPPGAPPDGYLSVMDGARSGRIAFDSRERGIDASPAIIKVNAAEAEELTGEADPARAVVLLGRQGGGLAIVTVGADGAVAFDGEHVLAVRLDAYGAFPVGSGDCFLAGLVVAFDARAGLADALRLAAGAAAANAEVPGAAVFERARAEELAARATIDAR